MDAVAYSDWSRSAFRPSNLEGGDRCCKRGHRLYWPNVRSVYLNRDRALEEGNRNNYSQTILAFRDHAREAFQRAAFYAYDLTRCNEWRLFDWCFDSLKSP